MGQADTPRRIEPTDTLEQDRIEPGFGRKLQNIVTDSRLHLAVALAALIVSVSGIVCNPGDDDSDGSDVMPPVAGETEPDGIG